MSKVIISLILLGLVSVNSNCIEKQNCIPEPTISAKSAVVISADSGEKIFAKNESEPMPMASTTKIMTALIALENSDLCNKEVSITDEMVRVEGSSMGLRAKDVISLYSLCQGMLLCSGNDAANSVALAIGGTREKFVDLMNEKARQIGLKDTCFVTPSGLDSGCHHSTAMDMAILGAYAMENEKFYDIVSKKSMKVSFIYPPKTCTYSNHNKLLKMYDGCVGIKTGFTKKAGRCLVSCAERDGIRLVAVTLNAPSDWNDHKTIYDYSFSRVEGHVFDDSNFEVELPVVGSDEDKVTVRSVTSKKTTFKKEDVSKIKRVIELPRFLYSPLNEKQVVGRIVYYIDDNIVFVNPIRCTKSVNYKKKDNFLSKIIKNIKSFLGKD